MINTYRVNICINHNVTSYKFRSLEQARRVYNNLISNNIPATLTYGKGKVGKVLATV